MMKNDMAVNMATNLASRELKLEDLLLLLLLSCLPHQQLP